MINEKKPWLLVRHPDYFEKVLDSMRNVDSNAAHSSAVFVRFGQGGDGVNPNYQVETTPLEDRHTLTAVYKNVFPTRGDNHQLDRRARGGRYQGNKLSAEHFTYRDVQALLERCRERRHDQHDRELS